MYRHRFPAVMVLAAAALLLPGRLAAQDETADRPNVLWLTCEDISPNLGCYGDAYAITPHLDRLAQRGVRYTQAVGITGVCAVNRSCLITGMYSSTIGSQDMRSVIRLPEPIHAYGHYLRRAGYYCTNNSKTDYNFSTPKDVENDPHMLSNLADDPKYAPVVERMRSELRTWQLRTRDLGLLTEYEMHRRADGSSQYEVGQSRHSYPLEKILTVAEIASQRSAQHVDQLIRSLNDDEPAVRWWAATGLTALGEDAGSAQSALKSSLQDASPIVRLAAAEALCNLGQVDDVLPVLTDGLKHTTPYVRLRAINALDRLRQKARPALPAIRSATMERAPFPGTYLNRMVQYVPKRLGR